MLSKLQFNRNKEGDENPFVQADDLDKDSIAMEETKIADWIILQSFLINFTCQKVKLINVKLTTTTFIIIFVVSIKYVVIQIK